MEVPEGMEAAPRNLELVEDGHKCLSHDVLRDEEFSPAIQEEPFAFKRRDVLADDPGQRFGHWQDRLAVGGFWSLEFSPPYRPTNGEQVSFEEIGRASCR